jgi:hypothetical protein
VTAGVGVALALVGCTPPAAGVGEVDLDAVGALMVYDPAHPELPGWRPLCGVALVHARVVQTAGHCVQGLRASLAMGSVEAAWISFQADPTAFFDGNPSDEDPAGGGWYAIESLHDNPDNFDFVELRRDSAAVRSIWGRFHDTGAIVLTTDVVGARPLTMASAAPGAVADVLERAGCGGGGDGCRLLEVSFGLEWFPPPTTPPVLVRKSSYLRYRGVDSLFVLTFDEPPGSEYGASCPGDSGSPIILVDASGARGTVVAISSSPAEPFGEACGGGGLQYRVDTESHTRFMEGIIASVDLG